MSEQGPIQSSVSVFVEWAKARLDEMAAIAKVLDSRLDSLDANGTLRRGKVCLLMGWTGRAHARR
jgi:hypothetical protein